VLYSEQAVLEDTLLSLEISQEDHSGIEKTRGVDDFISLNDGGSLQKMFVGQEFLKASRNDVREHLTLCRKAS
jgi:hypothetical protein